MPHTIEELILSIEYSIMKIYGPIENLISVFETNEVKAFLCPSIDWEEINRVGLARFKTSEEANLMVKIILEKYKQLNRTIVSWFVSQHTTPNNFAEILQVNNFSKHSDIWGMVRPMNKPLDIKIDSKFTYKEYSLQEMKNFSAEIKKMIEASYGMPSGASDMLASFIESAGDNIVYSSFIAYDNNKPIAFGGLSKLKGTFIGLLSGSATLPEYRKQGIYSGMLKIRYDKAKKEGLEYLIIQGKAETSAPIAQKNGFEKICNLDVYVWKAKANEIS